MNFLPSDTILIYTNNKNTIAMVFTVENFKSYANKQGWFSLLNDGHDVRFELKPNVSSKGLLTVLRKVFPDNYVGKEGRKYTIYHGDKETQKLLNTPIHFYNQNDAIKELKDELNKLKLHVQHKLS